MPRARASRTAETVVWLRAAGAREPDARVRNPDHLARDFINRRFAILGQVPGGWRLTRHVFERLAPGYYEYEIARTKHIDRVLRGELEAGLEQLVLIGSGYDSRPYRFASELAGVRTLEVDQDATIQAKRRRASRRGYGSDGVAYVPLDLGSHRPLDTLAGRGYDDAARTLFVCSGVLMYLVPPAVDQLLAFVRDSRADSSICFDYVYRRALEDPAHFYGAEQMIRNVERAGEPYRFSVDEADLGSFLAQRGHQLRSNLGPSALERSYLTRSDGSTHGRVCEYLGIAHAGRLPR